MRAAVLALLAALPGICGGLQVSVSLPVHAVAHPVRAYRSVRADRRLLAIADAVLQGANVVDYVTTRRGAFPGTGGCELNPLLVQAPCQIDVPRFTGIKLVVGAFGVAQWLPVLAGWGGDRYVRALTVVDAAIAIPLAIADINNVIQLTK